MIAVTWQTALFARSANVSALDVRVPFNVTVSAGHVTREKGNGKAALNVTMPSPVKTCTGIILGHAPGSSDKETDGEEEISALPSFGRGPSAIVRLSSVAAMKFRSTGHVIETMLRYMNGVRIRTSGKDGKFYGKLSGKKRRPPGRGYDAVDVCDGCHRRRVRVKPLFRNMTGYIRTTNTGLGFNNTDFNEPVVKTGKALRACVGAASCNTA